MLEQSGIPLSQLNFPHILFLVPAIMTTITFSLRYAAIIRIFQLESFTQKL